MFLALLVSVLLQNTPNAASETTTINYRLKEGDICINAPYIQDYKGENQLSCATLCSVNQRCQAFTIHDGPCQLFVFDKCSKSVRNCSCSRRGQVFVKQQPGLEPGALCPSGYGDDLCGVKYKVYTGSGFWWPSRARCENDSGLVIMADVMDATEMNHVNMLYSKHCVGFSILLGGYQTPGSPEPAGGWYWVGCNITVDNSLWTSGEPNNEYGREHAVGRWSLSSSGLSDFWELTPASTVVLCECVSPFF